jgi:DNA-binding NtrC family response regulator
MADARGTVLIVDDDPISVEVLGDYLTRKQLGVVRARTVDQALAELDSERPEVAVVGVRLGDTGELKALTAAAPIMGFAEVTPEPTVSSPQTLLYTLALEVFRATRPFSPEARASVGTALDQGALQAMQRGVSGEKAEVIRALNQVRTLIRFSKDLGDLDEATATRLEEFMGRARRSVGLS